MTSAEPTLPGLLLERVRTTPDGVAFRQQRFALWHEVTWAQCWSRVSTMVSMLAGLEVRRGDTVWLLSSGAVESLIVDLALQVVGAVVVRLPRDTTDGELADAARLAAPRFVLCEDPDDAPVVEGCEQFRTSANAPTVVVVGAVGGRHDPADAEQEAAARRPGDVAAIVLAADSSGAAVAVPLTGTALVAAARAIAQTVPSLAPARRILTTLPMSDALGRVVAEVLPLMSGCTGHLADAAMDVTDVLREVRPDLLVTASFTLEHLRARHDEAISRTSPLKGAVYRRCENRVLRAGSAATPGSRLKRGLTRGAWLLSGAQVLSWLGLRHVGRVLVAGERIPGDQEDWFAAMGLPFAYAMDIPACAALPDVGAEATHETAEMARHLRASPFVRSSVVLPRPGGSHSALVELEVPAVASWARRYSLPHGSVAVLARVPEVHELLAGHVARVNDMLSEDRRIADFAILPESLSRETGELDWRGAVRPSVVAARWSGLLDRPTSADRATEPAVK